MGPIFGKRHYEAVARELQHVEQLLVHAYPEGTPCAAHIRDCVMQFRICIANMLAADNPPNANGAGFKRSQFYRACMPGADVKRRKETP
jgi:hypothetical protein